MSEVEILDMIIAQMIKDVEEFEGKPFNGKTVGELHGKLCATVSKVAEIMKLHIEIEHKKPQTSLKQKMLDILSVFYVAMLLPIGIIASLIANKKTVALHKAEKIIARFGQSHER